MGNSSKSGGTLRLLGLEESDAVFSNVWQLGASRICTSVEVLGFRSIMIVSVSLKMGLTFIGLGLLLEQRIEFKFVVCLGRGPFYFLVC